MIQQIISGLAAGSSYSLMALALVLVMKTTNVANFAQAEIGLIAAFVAASLIDAGYPYFAAVGAALVVAYAIGVVIEWALIRRLIGESHLSVLLLTIGLFLTLNSLTAIVWGGQSRILSSPFDGSFEVSGQIITVAQLVSIGAGLLLTAAMMFLFRTPWGIRMQAIAEDPVTPRLLGVRVNTLFSLSWGLGGVASAVALILLTQSTFLSETSASGLILKGFVAATIGGFASVPGALIGGLVLGVLENLSGAYISSGSKSAVALLVILVILTVRTEGVFGSRSREL